MRSIRSAAAPDPRLFGRGRRLVAQAEAAAAAPTLSDDARLFAATFAAGFLFVSVFIV